MWYKNEVFFFLQIEDSLTFSYPNSFTTFSINYTKTALCSFMSLLETTTNTSVMYRISYFIFSSKKVEKWKQTYYIISKSIRCRVKQIYGINQ